MCETKVSLALVVPQQDLLAKLMKDYRQTA